MIEFFNHAKAGKLQDEFIVEDLAKLPREDWDFIRYEDLIKNSATEIARICRFGGLEMDDRLLQRVASPLPLSRTAKTPASPDKWRRYETELNEILPSTRKTSDAVDAFIRL
jgi:Sulfotransferase domain